jgi:uncharacterized metal-binding protein YceD (DUF177 family)
VTYYDSDEFDVGEFVHEILAVSVPEYPLCSGLECRNQKEADELLYKLNSQPGFEANSGHPAFAALKKLRV